MKNQKPLIAFLLPNLGMGGAERVFITLSAQFAARGYLVDLLVSRAEGPLLTQIPENVRLVDLRTGSEARSLFAITRYIKNYQPYALLSTLELMSLVTLLARKLAGGRAMVLIREASTPSLLPRKRWKKVVEQWLLRSFFPSADALVAVSHGVAADLQQFASLDSGKIRTIYNPVLSNDDISAQMNQPLAHLWFTPDAPPVIMAMGRLIPEKNYPLLIRAFARISNLCDARLVIFGEGAKRGELEALIRDLDLHKRIDLPGVVPVPYPYMRLARVFVLSSDVEGLPNVLIQAMACGCPVVSTDCPSGPREILDGGKYGDLVPVGDEAALASAILRVLGEKRRAVDAAWLQQFEVGRVADQYLNALGLRPQ